MNIDEEWGSCGTYRRIFKVEAKMGEIIWNQIWQSAERWHNRSQGLWCEQQLSICNWRRAGFCSAEMLVLFHKIMVHCWRITCQSPGESCGFGRAGGEGNSNAGGALWISFQINVDRTNLLPFTKKSWDLLSWTKPALLYFISRLPQRMVWMWVFLSTAKNNLNEKARVRHWTISS